MTSRLLYAVPVPEDARPLSRGQLQRRLAKRGQLGGRPVTEVISLQPGERLLRGTVAGRFAALTARELEELFGADGIEVVPFAGRSSQTDADGYYATEDVELRREDPRTTRYHDFDGRLIQKGTTEDSVRTIQTNRQPVTNPVGSGPTTEIAAPAAATTVRWFDPTSGTIESATAQRTQTGEHGGHSIYDVTEPSFSSPALTYDLPLADEYKFDARVWDDYDRSKTTTVDGTTVVQWQRVFSTAHQFRGAVIFESDLLRLTFDTANNSLTAERWDTGTSSYSSVSLENGTTWELATLDVSRIGQARVAGQVEFRDVNNDNRYRLDCELARGRTDALWTQPANADPAATPFLLETWAQGTDPYTGDTGIWSRTSDSSTRSGFALQGSPTSTSDRYHLYASDNRDDVVAGDDISTTVKVSVEQTNRLALFVQDPSVADPDRVYIEFVHGLSSGSGEGAIYEVVNGSATQLTSTSVDIGSDDIIIDCDTSESSGETALQVNITQPFNDDFSLSATTTAGLTSGSFGVELITNGDNQAAVWDPIRVDADAATKVPAGIRDLINPIALSTEQAATPSKDLIAREEVRR